MLVKKLYRFLTLCLTPPRPKIEAKIVEYNYNQCLRGKVIVIIGGSRGIGKAIAVKCVSEGAKVIASGRTQSTLDSLKSEVSSAERFFTEVFDNSDTDKINTFVSYLFEKYGNVDALVLCAGISLHEGDFRNVTIDGFEHQMNVNLEAPYFFAKSYLNVLLERKLLGNILFISSETAAKSNDLPYGLSKVAINSLIGGLSRRVISKGIRINAIAPGVTLTDMTSKNACTAEDISNTSPLGRFILPQEIANIAVFLLSDACQCVSGQIMYCDAGNHLKINGFESEYSIK